MSSGDRSPAATTRAVQLFLTSLYRPCSRLGGANPARGSLNHAVSSPGVPSKALLPPPVQTIQSLHENGAHTHTSVEHTRVALRRCLSFSRCAWRSTVGGTVSRDGLRPLLFRNKKKDEAETRGNGKPRTPDDETATTGRCFAPGTEPVAPTPRSSFFFSVFP